MTNKTPLQELIEWLSEQEDAAGDNETYQCIQRTMSKATELLEKEKSIIVDAYNEGKYYGSGTGSIDRLKDNGSDYFNQTFIQ